MTKKFGTVTVGENKRVRINDFLEVEARRVKGKIRIDFWLIPLMVKRGKTREKHPKDDRPELTQDDPPAMI